MGVLKTVLKHMAHLGIKYQDGNGAMHDNDPSSF